MDEPLDLSKKRLGPWDDSENGNVYKVDVEENIRGELYVSLPKKLMENLNWHPGDVLIWEETEVLGDNSNYCAALISKKKHWNENKK